MEGQFHVGRRSSVTTQESYEDLPALNQNRPAQAWQLVTDIERVLGADVEPDPLFFVESWSLGVPAAVENFQRRRQKQADLECNGNASLTRNNFPAQSFVEERELHAEFFSSSRAAAISGRDDAGCPPQFTEESAAWMQDSAPQPWRTAAEEFESGQETTSPMTQQRACQLLGVTATSTRRQIKAAYRQLVNKWHPDRFECRTEEVRQFATGKMVEINAAYRLLRSGLANKPN